jgi:hypothetical protein
MQPDNRVYQGLRAVLLPVYSTLSGPMVQIAAPSRQRLGACSISPTPHPPTPPTPPPHTHPTHTMGRHSSAACKAQALHWRCGMQHNCLGTLRTTLSSALREAGWGATCAWWWPVQAATTGWLQHCCAEVMHLCLQRLCSRAMSLPAAARALPVAAVLSSPSTGAAEWDSFRRCRAKPWQAVYMAYGWPVLPPRKHSQQLLWQAAAVTATAGDASSQRAK